MGCHIAHDSGANVAILYCSTADWAFGPVFLNGDDHDADERAEAFLRWLDTTETWWGYEKEALLRSNGRDPRELTERALEQAYRDWRGQEAAQWAREAAAEALDGADLD